jgi:hypothetical protein
MFNKLAVLVVSIALAAMLVGCSDESIVPTDNEQSNTTALVRGEIDPGSGSFEYEIEPSGGRDPGAGPFVLRGNNIHYVDSLMSLSVDFSIENNGEVSHPEPIGLTFVNFLPKDVTVKNPDNDEHGPGAGILFEFDNDDGRWTPGEKSFPRTVQFGVDGGSSIGFIGHVNIPEDTLLGTIGGVVWNDLNENGEIDDDEPGIGGAVVYLIADSDPEATLANADYRWRTETGRDGSYRFEGLESGHYRVIKDVSDRHWKPTTPTVIDVILVEKDGNVSDFLMADFGCVSSEEPPPPAHIEIGDYVKVNGEFTDDPDDRIIARSITVLKCEIPPPPDTLLTLSGHGDRWDDCNDWDYDWEDCDDFACWGLKNELRGPVTDINRDECTVEIMGSWVSFALCDTTCDGDKPEVSAASFDGDHNGHWLDLDDVEIGDRVWARVFRHPSDGNLYGFRLKEWLGTPEKAFGKVEQLSPSDGRVEAIVVLGVLVKVTERTDIHYRD